MAAGSVDAVITDLPYGTTRCKWDAIIPLEPMWEQVKRVCRGVFITTGSQPFTSKLIVSNIEEFGYEMIWKKRRITGFLDAERKPLKAHENILVFGKRSKYNPQMARGDNHKRGALKSHGGQARVYGEHGERTLRTSNEWYPQSVVEFSHDPSTTVTVKHRPNKTENHPTQKPVDLYAYLVATYTDKGDTVFDLCFGSGTTGVACAKLGRKFIGCEIDPTYYAIAEKRIREAYAQPLLLAA